MSEKAGYVSLIFEKGSDETLKRLDIAGFKTHEGSISIHEAKPNELFVTELTPQPFDLGFEVSYDDLVAEFVTSQTFTTATLIDGDTVTDLTA